MSAGVPPSPPPLVPRCTAQSLQLELLDPGSVPLMRLYRHAGGDFSAAPPEHRNLRVDPPEGCKEDYGVLYTAGNVATVAMECWILKRTGAHSVWDVSLAQQYRIARYTFTQPALFLPLDGANRPVLRIDGWQDDYKAYQAVAHELFQRFGQLAHGLSWESQHRGQPGRVYAIWDHRKMSLGLSVDPARSGHALTEDAEWNAFLAEYPTIQALAPSAPPAA